MIREIKYENIPACVELIKKSIIKGERSPSKEIKSKEQ